MLYAAGATFYLAIATVPLVLVAIRLASLLIGPDRVQRLGLTIVDTLPSNLQAPNVVDSLLTRGTRLGWPSTLLSLLPASLYGEGLRRALSRLAPEPEGALAIAWRGRLLALLLFAVSPLMVLTVLFATSWIESVAGTGLGGQLLGGYLGFLVAWVLVSLSLALVYRAVAPGQIAVRALLWGAFGTGSFLAGFLVGFAIFLHLPVKAGGAFGGNLSVAGAAIAGGWLLMLHLVVLVGYAVTLHLDGRLPDRDP